MGKIIYDPRNKNKEVNVPTEENRPSPEQRIDNLIENLNSVRPRGNTDCDYAIYLEDYVYTYIYQFANTDLGSEHSAAIIGEYYPETKEVIICGVMPIPKNKLSQKEEWINQEALESLYEEKEKYFAGANILGWLHMQPGYGTMLTMKEVKVHRDLFNKEGSILLLVDPINKIETFYTYEDDMLKEQSGYYIYYDKNPSMQQYMLDKPLMSQEKEEVDDNVVMQFREIGRRRKKEYQDRKRTNFTVVAASIALLAMAAVLLRMGEQDRLIEKMTNRLENNNLQTQTSIPVNETIPFVFEPAEGKQVQEDSATDTLENSIVENKKETVNTEEVISTDVIANGQEEVGTEERINAEENASGEEVISSEKIADAEEKYQTYVVEEGDTLRRISVKHFNTELRTKEIIALNNLENGDHIYVGQQIKLPME